MRRPSFAGLVAAAAFMSLSLSPSLLPREWGFQAVVSGVVTAAGYGLGTLVGYVLRRVLVWRPPAVVPRGAWRGLGPATAIAVLTMSVLGIGWQDELHAMMGMTMPPAWGYLVAVVAGALLAAMLVFTARGCRSMARRAAGELGRWLPRRAANTLGGLLVAALVVGVLDGVVVRPLFSAGDHTFRVSDQVFTEEAVQPRSPLRSGSPGSAVSWDDLGSKGRAFVAGGPSVAQLSEFWGRRATEPIRVYAGLTSADTTDARVDLVLDELDRTGAWRRSVLVVATATGTGWVDPQAAAGIEYLWSGDTAVASLQYSYLPSWISFLVDSARAQEAGAALIDAVHERWAEMPVGERPLLLVFGESLGAYGSEAAFSGPADIRNRTDGALWAGPPNFSELWSSFTRDRDPGSPERLPVFEGGRHVRFASEPGDLHPEDPDPGQVWEHPRILYLQHASDPVVWWSPDLILRRPAWLVEQRGPDVLEKTAWFPLVTFTQMTVDLANSIEVPAGHGHNYTGLFADGWAAVAAPPGWQQADTDRLREVLSRRADAGLP